MKKIFAVLFVVFFVITSAEAAPWLICDPANPEELVTNYKVFMDAAPPVDSAPVGGALRYDLAGISNGQHTVKVQACNVWGCSGDSTPLVFIKALPSAPSIPRIVP